MWQLRVVSAFALTSLCLAASRRLTNEAGKECECVPYYQCLNGTIVEDGSGLIDIRSDGHDSDNATTSPPVFRLCDNYLEVCCEVRNKTSSEDEPSAPPLKKDECEKPHPDPDASSFKKTKCGRRQPYGVDFGAHADENHAKFGEFPWMVMIIDRNFSIFLNNSPKTANIYRCGGALIHPRAVLTAAHCLSGRTPDKLLITAGEWSFKNRSKVYPHQERNVNKIIIHEKFDSMSLRNNWAILILSTPVELAEHVDLVCLPGENDRFDGSRCVASGWGKDRFGTEGRYQQVLKSIELPVVPRDTCQNSLRDARLGRHFDLHSSFICAGGETDKDTCKGDSGSPLVCPLSNDTSRYVQAGIVSWGIDCGKTGIPGVYANVAAARKWIDEKMACNNLDTAAYTY